MFQKLVADMSTPKVFISYSSKDRPSAETIHKSVEAAGFAVWRDQTRLETEWSREIAFSLGDSDRPQYSDASRTYENALPNEDIVRQAIFRDMLLSAEEVLRILE